MFLRQSTCTSQDYYAHKWPFYLPQISLKWKWETSQNFGEDKIKDSSKLKLVIRPKSRRILLTFNQEDLFLAENIWASANEKTVTTFPVYTEKITHPSQ